APPPQSSSDIYQNLKELNFFGRALYIAAHPDDENTRLIAYLSKEQKARTAYLSVTRGDGGQNLIGQELRELLGVLRTQELLAARRVDGGEQYFTRANDFGYSKHPDETLKIWDKEAVLGDVVWVIRNFQPDVIINRFDHRTPGSTHGHHTSSAMLSTEAFDLAGDAAAYPGQLNEVDPWQPKRLFFNTSWWFYGSQENFEKADKSNMLTFDTGIYYPVLGKSNNEIAAQASSQHLSQGFGRMLQRGSENEYIELLKGDSFASTKELFDGIDTSWSRIEGGEEIGQLLYPLENNFNFKDPSVHLPDLLKAHGMLSALGDSSWKDQKLKELEQIILSVSGIFLEAVSDEPSSYPGGAVTVALEVINRSKNDVTLVSADLTATPLQSFDKKLEDNQKLTESLKLTIPADAAYSSPYWLNEKGSLGMYKVEDRSLIGQPETPREFKAVFKLNIAGYPLEVTRPIIHKYSEPDKGEIYRPFEILPEVTARFSEPVFIYTNGYPHLIPVRIRANRNNVKGSIALDTKDGWSTEETNIPFEIANKGDEITVNFSLTSPTTESESEIRPVISLDGKKLSRELVTIDYDHIPTQSVLLPASAKVVRLDIKKAGEDIGYIAGAGDLVPESLRQIGYKVSMIDPATIQKGSLDKYDAIVVGIRAYNVLDELKFKQPFLFEYVKKGGNLILQYNTAGRRDADMDFLAPYPLQLSRDRVSDENAPVDIIAPDHPLVNKPNTINQDDFEGWVQERGLYFPGSWDQAFTPILSMNDSGESPKKGSLLVAPYGKGHYIYTGLSFFRELPAGVPGAYKLFANMLSLGKKAQSEKQATKG
ncbi:MAG: PIG-L family deacetylase, partial [Flavobacteriaceae bacterium]|nr:PIG-L family deacetylase [Flavobacteriaceae bacterium]